jgi:hypothetical protein
MEMRRSRRSSRTRALSRDCLERNRKERKEEQKKKKKSKKRRERNSTPINRKLTVAFAP